MPDLKRLSMFKWFHVVVITLLIGVLLPTGSATVFAQGSPPPANPDNPATLPKSQLNVPKMENGSLDDKAATYNDILTLGATLINGNFEQGRLVGWSEYSTHGWYLVAPVASIGITSHDSGGAFAAWLGGDNNDTSIISQGNLSISTPTTLRLWYWIGSEDECGYDYGYVQVNSGTIYTWYLCSSTNTGGWVMLDLNLDAYIGQTVTLSVMAVTDNIFNSNLFIDDVALLGPRTISGNVGIAGAGATMSYTGGSTTADGSGNYSITVPYNWSGTVTPSQAGYAFSPISRSYSNVAIDQVGQDYTAFVPYTITGNAGIAGAIMTIMTNTGVSNSNGVPQFVIADGSGNYSINVPSSWSGTITPHKKGYAFTPASLPYSTVLSDQINQNYTAQVCAACINADTTGVFRPSNGLLSKNQNTTGFADVSINYGTGGDYPVVGDWDGDGTATIGIYRNGSFYLRNSNTLGFADLVFAFGQPGDQPVAGDWNGDGIDTIGIYRPSTGQFLLRNINSAGAADYSFYLGNVGDVGIAGDWTNKGFDTVGVFRPSNGIIFLKNTNQTGFADIALNYGLAGDQPVVGDWDNNGTDTIGVYRNGQFLLRNSNTLGFADLMFGLGNPGDMPIAGDWDGLP